MAGSVTRRTAEAIVALAMLGVGLAAVALAWRMPTGTLAQPGPRIFPTAVGLALCATALYLLVGTARSGERQQKIEFAHRGPLMTFAMLIFAAFAFERIGSVLTFAVFLTVLLRMLARLDWWQAVLAACASTAIAWSLFTYLLGLRLPGLPI